MDSENSLVRILEANNLDKVKQDYIMERFNEFEATIEEWETRAKQIVVTDESQVREMKMAREGRLLLRDKRIDVEKVRKALKAGVLLEGKAIDGVANALMGKIKPIEDYLDQQEKFKERKEAEREAALIKIRTAELAQFKDLDLSLYNLGDMSQEQFEALVLGLKALEDRKIEEAKKAEEERIAKEKADAEEKERQKVEDERLRAERLALQMQQKKIEEERAAIEAEKLALQQKQEAEEKAALQAKKDAQKAEKKARMAPDKDKILLLIDHLQTIPYPEVKSEEAKSIITVLQSHIQKLINNLQEEVEKL